MATNSWLQTKIDRELNNPVSLENLTLPFTIVCTDSNAIITQYNIYNNTDDLLDTKCTPVVYLPSFIICGWTFFLRLRLGRNFRGTTKIFSTTHAQIVFSARECIHYLILLCIQIYNRSLDLIRWQTSKCSIFVNVNNKYSIARMPVNRIFLFLNKLWYDLFLLIAHINRDCCIVNAIKSIFQISWYRDLFYG